MKSEEYKGITVEFINAPKGGPTFQHSLPDQLVKLAHLNKATRILIVFDRD